jgi:Domain of unknown function (DUF6457)
MNPLDAWLTEAGDALGVDAHAMQRDLLLDLTRDVAHTVTRPAAPLTAFLVGLAAGKAGGSAEDVRDAIRKLATVLAGHTPTQP